MKKISYLLNVVLLSIIIMAYSTYRNGNNKKKEDTFQSCADCDTAKNNFHYLTLGELKKDISRYNNTHAKVIDSLVNKLGIYKTGGKEKFKDARSCWYSLDTLKKFICLIEGYSEGIDVEIDDKGSPKQKIDKKDLGITFFYATYPKSDLWYKGKPGYESHHTLIMVPTYFSHKFNEDIVFDPSSHSGTPLWDNQFFNSASTPLVMESINSNPVQHTTVTPVVRRPALPRSAEISSRDIDLGKIKNQGYLCPPTCSKGITNLLENVDSDPAFSRIGW